MKRTLNAMKDKKSSVVKTIALIIGLGVALTCSGCITPQGEALLEGLALGAMHETVRSGIQGTLNPYDRP